MASEVRFDSDLAAELSRYTAGGRLTETVSFAYELARKPSPRVIAGKRSATRVSQLGTEVAGRTVYAPRNGAVGRRRNETCPDSSTR